MDSAANTPDWRKLVPFTAPMAAFLTLLTLKSVLEKPGSAFWLASPEYWLYPAQTVLCGLLLIWFWREYRFQAAKRMAFTGAIAFLAFALWIAPQASAGLRRAPTFNHEIFFRSQAATGPRLSRFFARRVVPLSGETLARFLLR